MNQKSLHIPQIKLTHHHTAIIIRWGVVGGLIFRPGDRLILGPVDDGQLVLLKPQGRGSIMFGRVHDHKLFAEPGMALASPIRWRVLDGVQILERAYATQSSTPQNSLPQICSLRTWRLPNGTTLGPLQLEALLHREFHRKQPQKQNPDTFSGGVVLGMTAAAARTVAPRPGWIRYVFSAPGKYALSDHQVRLTRDAHRLARIA